jgi:hypothetical protein
MFNLKNAVIVDMKPTKSQGFKRILFSVEKIRVLSNKKQYKYNALYSAFISKENSQLLKIGEKFSAEINISTKKNSSYLNIFINEIFK